MFEAQLKVTGRLTVKVSADKPKALFEELSRVGELFSQRSCGCCQSDDVFPQVRTVDKFSYYSVKCFSCGAEFKFGQKQDNGDLFPKYKDQQGNWLPDGGWSKYKPQQQASGAESGF
jgi:hypothetical protein